MEWDFESFMDKELWEICEEAERIERQKQEEKEIAQIISQLQTGEISEIEEQEQAQTEEVIQTKEGKTEEISEVEQETIEEIKEENLEFDESEKEAKQEIFQVVRTDDFKQIQSEADKAKKVKIFDSELAIEIVKSDKFKEDLILSLKDASRYNRRYIDIIKDLLNSEITEKYTRKKSNYLNVMLTLKGKKEVLKYLPPGAYPVVYENFKLRKMRDDFGHSRQVLEGELWIAINKDYKLYAVVIKDLQYNLPIKFPSVFNVAFLIVYPDNNVEFFVVDLYNNEKFPNTEFPIYAKCDKYCRWMPEPVLVRIESVIRDNIEYYQKYKQKQLQTQELVEEDKLLKNVLNKRIREYLPIAFYEWNKYVQNTYLVPYILPQSIDYLFPPCFKGKFRLINGWAKFFPKPVFLPKRIHIKNRYQLMGIPEGVYPIIRYYPKKRNIVFAISPNTEVVFEINTLTEELLIAPIPKNKPSPLFNEFDLAIVWNDTLTIYRLTDFDYDFGKTLSLPEQYKFSSYYWKIENEDEYMYYLPEPLFLLLVGEKVKTREAFSEQLFVAELIFNSQKTEGWKKWVKDIIDKYHNIKFDNEKLEVIDLSNLRAGAWYVKDMKKHYFGPYKHEYELVVINIPEGDRIYKVKTNLELELPEVESSFPIFITIWIDGTIARWILDAP
jgi:uncharacterized protein (DUF1697 family)